MDAQIKEIFQPYLDKVKRIEARHNQCARTTGHEYYATGFSRIAHPGHDPNKGPVVNDVRDIQFAAFVCEHCDKHASFAEVCEGLKHLGNVEVIRRAALVTLLGAFETAMLLSEIEARARVK